MFRKQEQETEGIKTNDNRENFVNDVSEQKINTILKGSKLIGDINISYDLELTGEVEGNITSEQNSNIVIKGICNGNIRTSGGNVTIEGESSKGDIIAGGDVKITGKFNGGTIKAKGKIYVNGEFDGKFEGNDIEIGSNAKGKGELLYKEYISISRGAKVEVQVKQIQEEVKVVKKSPNMKVVNIERPVTSQ